MKNNLLLLSTTLLLLIAQTTLAQNIPSYLPKDGLVGWWPFNGNANDESGNGNNGTVNGATLTSDRFGNTGKAYSFDGVNDFIRCVNAGPTGNPTVSVCFWMKTTSSNYGSLFGYGDNGANGRDFRIYLNSGHCSGSSISFDTYQCAVSHSSSISNSWDFYTVIYDGTIGNTVNIAKIYKNRYLMNSVCFSQNFATTNVNSINPITFGRYHGTIQSGFYNGTLDDIAIWNRALSEQEIKNLYTGNICYQSVSVTDTLFINSSITSFNPITFENTIKIYPNPSQGQLTIDFGNINTLSSYQMKVINPIGQQIFQSNITQRISTIALSSFSAKGIYFVQLIDSKGEVRENRKIVIR